MFQWFKKQYETEGIEKIYNIVVSQSRRPELFAEFSVADTLDGRFDLLSLHMCLIFKRLKLEDNSHKQFSQLLFDFMFQDMDRSLREIGVGDLSVGKRVKEMGRAFLGRLEVYEAVIKVNDISLEGALIRNVYRSDPLLSQNASKLAHYVRRVDAKLADIPIELLIRGEFTFEFR
ncbi:MAG: ubiquinol-cytochrome C chaperone [Rhodospirillaceae bacterium]|nr:ubiquinol-cytochrome C chaperone [Rhodospirillaceae bacterium]